MTVEELIVCLKAYRGSLPVAGTYEGVVRPLTPSSLVVETTKDGETFLLIEVG